MRIDFQPTLHAMLQTLLTGLLAKAGASTCDAVRYEAAGGCCRRSGCCPQGGHHTCRRQRPGSQWLPEDATPRLDLVPLWAQADYPLPVLCYQSPRVAT